MPLLSPSRSSPRRAATTTTAAAATAATAATAASRRENTGDRQRCMSAGEPEEADAYQVIFDDLINSEADYDVEVELGRRLRGAVPDPGRGRHPRRGRRAPARRHRRPGRGGRRSWRSRTWASTSTSSNEHARRVVHGARRVEGKHYGLPTNINLKSMVWYPKDDFDAAGYEVPETWDDLIALSDQIVDDGGTPWCVGFESGAPPAGRPPTGWRTSCSAPRGRTSTTSGSPTRSRSTTRRCVAAGETFGEVMFADGYVLGGAADDRRHRLRRRPGADVRRPARAAGCTARRASSTPFFPEDAEAGRRLRLVPAARRSTRRAPSTPVSSPSWAATATVPRSSTSSTGSSPRTCSARWAACRPRPASRRT